MSITNPKHYPKPAAAALRTTAAASASASRGLGGEDQTDLSGAHAQVQALVAEASQLPEVREERVQALRQAVERGGYSTSPEAVAGALVGHMLAARTAAYLWPGLRREVSPALPRCDGVFLIRGHLLGVAYYERRRLVDRLRPRQSGSR